jgi:glycosyltransferase involved in cell wall biosynthesis
LFGHNRKWLSVEVHVVQSFGTHLFVAFVVHFIYKECHYKMSITIGLCMIVKDEAKVILDALKSTLPIIDTFCIVDTGSSDSTIQVIKDFYESHNMKGHVHERPWVDFGTNRSEALKLCDGHMDYILMMDADDIMNVPSNGKETLKALLASEPNHVMVQLRLQTLEYYRSQIFKANDDWRYVGVLHEYPTNGKENKSIELRDFYIDARTVGHRSNSVDKYIKDSINLEAALLKEPTNERYVFYLAQSYKDSGNVEKAVENYIKRYNMGHWVEERYVSALNVCRLTSCKEWAWKAHELCPWRNESLVSYMVHCRGKDLFTQELFSMALLASTIEKPSQALFLDASSYWRVWDELAIIAYYTGHYDVAMKASEKSISMLDRIPAVEHERIKNNLKFAQLAFKINDKGNVCSSSSKQ